MVADLKPQVSGPSNEDLAPANHHEWTDYRETFFTKLLAALNHPEHPANKVHSLSIVHLQDLVSPDIATSPNFKAVLSRLDSVDLCVATEAYDPAPETEISISERHEFFTYDLIKYWLKPLQAQLVHLKICTPPYPTTNLIPSNIRPQTAIPTGATSPTALCKPSTSRASNPSP